MVGPDLTELDSGTHSFSGDANKRWVNWALSITPAQAENLVGTSHTFVVKVTHDAGAGGGLLPLAGAKPVINLAGLGTISANTCSVGTDALGICTVTITSAVPGTSTVSATFEAALDQASISLAAQGNKLWVNYRLVASPKTAVNPVGTIGSALAGNCTTDAAGTCRVTITSALPGLATLQAGYNATVGATSAIFTDSGDKLWEAVPIAEVAGTILVAEELPRTGAGIAGQAWLAMSMISTGSLLHLVGRRRRSHRPSV